jgi:hypothetical protein
MGYFRSEIFAIGESRNVIRTPELPSKPQKKSKLPISWLLRQFAEGIVRFESLDV